MSAAPLAGNEVAFFDAPPQYSVMPPVLVSEAPPPRPSLVRTLLSKALFVLIAGAALLLLWYEASVLSHRPWLEPKRVVKQMLLG